MRYLKGFAVGFLTAFVAVVVLVVTLVRFASADGVGTASVMVGSWQVLGAALLGFALGFWWMLKRERNQ